MISGGFTLFEVYKSVKRVYKKLTGKPLRINNSNIEKIKASDNHNDSKSKDKKSVVPVNIEIKKNPYTPRHSDMFSMLYKVK